ncbi:hypothetical protein AVEN_25751-1 [Araneus ventricosus]|uniref:Uncharacterized protein n=1 Tax=Araneus ventricosus TaxID=182803 RepID=A0A4Y2NR59_ARAVE|nr:hypothetical protein AVEN_25751-1 [Araneus ventricosus]
MRSNIEATRRLFWDGPRHFEPWLDDEDDTRDGTPSPNFHTTPTGGRLGPICDFACNRPTYTEDLQWNRVSDMEPYLPLGHRGP